MLIDSLVLSRFSYALPVWGPMLSKSQVYRLQNLYNLGWVLLLAYGSMILCLVTINVSIGYQCHP